MEIEIWLIKSFFKCLSANGSTTESFFCGEKKMLQTFFCAEKSPTVSCHAIGD